MRYTPLPTDAPVSPAAPANAALCTATLTATATDAQASSYIQSCTDCTINTAVRPRTWDSDRLLFDSGAAVHVCPYGYAPEYPIRTSGDLPALQTATGESSTVHGTRAIYYQMDARATLKVQFIVADVAMLVLSVS